MTNGWVVVVGINVVVWDVSVRDLQALIESSTNVGFKLSLVFIIFILIFDILESMSNKIGWDAETENLSSTILLFLSSKEMSIKSILDFLLTKSICRIWISLPSTIKTVISTGRFVKFDPPANGIKYSGKTNGSVSISETYSGSPIISNELQ